MYKYDEMSVDTPDTLNVTSCHFVSLETLYKHHEIKVNKTLFMESRNNYRVTTLIGVSLRSTAFPLTH